ncbi:hypothetical protein BDY19DRAFT_930605 [Irpex rosettiformis]|uniref:Uncharacterized protein n=1 Tax=Irpex rosettiformis TaxID=378272 RepID=A0ACB8UB50_9APHY|nr:hypothetical protein BDY19DRAFT_930605 [Irpex rosettiformis]
MSSRYAQSDADWAESRPDKPLVVKCRYEGANKRITFGSSRTCTFDLLRHRVEQCFSLPPTYAITYTDDDGETTDITTESDLTEAIRYFHPGDDPPLSSAASILSGRSFGRGKITLRVNINVDYDGPSLSDTSSLASREEFESRNGSEFSLSLSASITEEIEDDSVTVSSKDMGSKYDVYRARGGPRTIVSGPSREPLVQKPSTARNDWDSETVSSVPQSLSLNGSGLPSIVDRDESAYETLQPEAGPAFAPSPLSTERGAAWLREQNSRTLRSLIGSPRVPSEIDEFSLNDTGSIMSGELALQKDRRGKFYYAYTSASSSTDASSILYDVDGSGMDSAELDERDHRPTSRDLRWFQEQAQLNQVQSEPVRPSSSNSHHNNHRSYSEPAILREDIPPDIPPELLPFIEGMLPLAPPRNPTDCSNCGALLETFRYVCATCGEKDPAPKVSPFGLNGTLSSRKGKGKDISPSSSTSGFAYPPRPTHAASASASSWTLLSSDNGDPFHDNKAVNSHKPLPALPYNHPSSPESSPSSLTIQGLSIGSGRSTISSETGYELCHSCFASVGVVHALESCIAPGSSPIPDTWPPSPEDQQRAFSAWKRTASKKGQLRHAYIEKVWGPRGWDNVEHDDESMAKCSTCSSTIAGKRYKCAMCVNINLCKACYSQVHEIHPSHPFLLIQEKLIRSQSEPAIELPTLTPDETGELPMKHPGVKCFHCLQDIVGARFHCAICSSIDICSNCESAGLPGNLDSTDDGHNSSHIMIKIPYPLPSEELESASRTAKQLWRKDAASIEDNGMRKRRDSFVSSSYTRTVMGQSSSSLTSLPVASVTDDHGLLCRNCGRSIVGVRYQCALCPSNPEGYNLCLDCEPHSYAIHDPMHIFLKLPRPVDHPIQSDIQILPPLYRIPAGPPGGVYSRERPKEYLRDVIHKSAVCDRCMTHIVGEWFRCVYCAKDLCDACEAVDTHNDTHFFMVFKSSVDMKEFRKFARLDDDTNPPEPVIPYAVYLTRI